MRQQNVKSAEYRPIGTRTARRAGLTGTIALSTVLLAMNGSSALAQAGAGGTGAPAGTPGGQGQGGQGAPGAPAAGAQGTGTPGANSPGVGAPTAAPAVSGQGGLAAQDASANGQGGTAGTGTNGGSVPGTGAQDSPNFDLARTVAAAVSSSAAYIQAQRNVQIDRKHADEVAGQARPMIDADGSATRFDQATTVALSGQKFQVIGNHTEALSLNVSDRLDLLGIVRAQTNQARLQALADTFTLSSIANERILEGQTTYFTLLRAIHEVSVARAALRNAEEAQAVAKRLYEGQIGQKIDYLRANTQVATAQQNLTSAINSRDIARASFNDLVGRPLTAPVFLTDVPGVNVGIDIPTGAAANADATVGGGQTTAGFVPYAAPVASVNAIDVDKMIASAVTVRPEVLQLATQQRAANVGVRIARSGLEPTFSLSASGNYYPTPSFQYPRQRTVAVTAAVSIPLYDGGVTRDRISEARLRTQNAQTALDSAKEDVTLQVRQAYLNLATAARQIDAANAALQQAIAARQLAQVRYEGQVGLYLEVTDAQSALVQAETGQVVAVYNYLIARAQFENATGTPIVTNDALAPSGTAAPTTPGAPPAPTVVAPGTPPAGAPPTGTPPTNPPTPAVPTPVQPQQK